MNYSFQNLQALVVSSKWMRRTGYFKYDYIMIFRHFKIILQMNFNQSHSESQNSIVLTKHLPSQRTVMIILFIFNLSSSQTLSNQQ